ncbi:MAG TPA: hypothetical protein VK151_09050 [Fluviicola sp.]|nr:hypothetical protein [Fluviicola sp.]
MKETITEMIEVMQKKHPNDPTVISDLEIIETLLTKDSRSTIDCLNQLNETEISWISACFEEISAKLKSKELIQCFKQLVIKYPNISYLKQDVQDAIDVVDL